MKDRLLRWQVATVALMVLGYAGYYICRVNLSVAMPQLIQDLAHRGVDPATAKEQLGWVAAMGTLAYAIGKLLAGFGTDLMGGRRSFLAGMAGAVLFTVLFTLGGGVPYFTLAWVGNRLIQSVGWVGMVRITGRWFRYSAYARVMGIISLSYLFGDAAARKFLSILIGYGANWRQVFWAAAGALLLLFLLNAAVLKETPRELGMEEAEGSPVSLVKSDPVAAEGRKRSALELAMPLFRNPGFWILCVICLGFTVVRETFNTWTPTFFTEALRFSKAEAAEKSALFPLFGGVAVIACGFLGDRMGNRGRTHVIVWGPLLCTLTLLALGLMNFGESSGLAVALTAAAGFLLLGPYSYISGCLSLDLGGKEASATACGLLDGAGYLGGVLAGSAIAQVSVRFGWHGAFLVLAATTGLSTALALAFQFAYRPPEPEPLGALEPSRA